MTFTIRVGKRTIFDSTKDFHQNACHRTGLVCVVLDRSLKVVKMDNFCNDETLDESSADRIAKQVTYNFFDVCVSKRTPTQADIHCAVKNFADFMEVIEDGHILCVGIIVNPLRERVPDVVHEVFEKFTGKGHAEFKNNLIMRELNSAWSFVGKKNGFSVVDQAASTVNADGVHANSIGLRVKGGKTLICEPADSIGRRPEMIDAEELVRDVVTNCKPHQPDQPKNLNVLYAGRRGLEPKCPAAIAKKLPVDPTEVNWVLKGPLVKGKQSYWDPRFSFPKDADVADETSIRLLFKNAASLCDRCNRTHDSVVSSGTDCSRAPPLFELRCYPRKRSVEDFESRQDSFLKHYDDRKLYPAIFYVGESCAQHILEGCFHQSGGSPRRGRWAQSTKRQRQE